MAVKVIDGDLFTTKAKYVCHQVNCKGRMGSGIAKTVRAKYPEAYQQYQFATKGPEKPLGHAHFASCKDGKVVINMFAQDGYGYDGSIYTNYDAFVRCLSEIRSFVPAGATIAMPYKIGCGLGGGDWETIYGMIEQELGTDCEVELWRLV